MGEVQASDHQRVMIKTVQEVTKKDSHIFLIGFLSVLTTEF